MEKTVTTSIQESSDASSIYRDRASADFAVQNTASVAGNLVDAMRDSIVIFVPSFIVTDRSGIDDDALTSCAKTNLGLRETLPSRAS